MKWTQLNEIAGFTACTSEIVIKGFDILSSLYGYAGEKMVMTTEEVESEDLAAYGLFLCSGSEVEVRLIRAEDIDLVSLDSYGVVPFDEDMENVSDKDILYAMKELVQICFANRMCA